MSCETPARRHERAVDDFTTALDLLKPNAEPRATSSPYDKGAAEQKTNNRSGSGRGNSPRGYGGADDDYDYADDGDDDGDHRGNNLATIASEGMAESKAAVDDDSSSNSDSKNRPDHEHGNQSDYKYQEYGSTSGAIGSAAGVEDGYLGAKRDSPADDGGNASERVSRGDGEDGMVEWGSVAGACHYAR